MESEVLKAVGALFEIPGSFDSGVRFGSGHIHRTFLVEYRDRNRSQRYLQQELNQLVFPDPAALMENLVRVLEHLRGKGPATRCVPTLLPARGGGYWARDARGACWRTWLFIEGSESFDAPRDAAMAYRAARAFGEFQRELLDLPGPRLHETIPGFHDTRARLARLHSALARDELEREGSVAAELRFALEREELAGALPGLHLEERIVHNDTKLGNVLFDTKSGEALAVVDLDTVMPGLSLHDFGDLVRTASHHAAEDDPSGMRVDEELFEALARGYLEALRGIVSPAERDALVLAGRVIAYECGLRFLTDHLEGDRYFGVRYPGQNALRCRAQFALVRSLEQSEPALRRLLERS